jgi:uncharacterized protein (TIGR00369 family)
MPKMLEVMQAMVRGEVPGPPIGKLLNMRLVEVEQGRAVFELEADEQHWNPMGTVHGGVLCDIADGALGIALASTLEEGESFTTLELKINFLKPVWKGKLRAVGKLLKRGNTIGLAECDVFDAGGSLVAHATSTLMVLRGAQAQGR